MHVSLGQPVSILTEIKRRNFLALRIYNNNLKSMNIQFQFRSFVWNDDPCDDIARTICERPCDDCA